MNLLLGFNPVKKLLVLSLMVLLTFGTILVAAPAGADTILNAKVTVKDRTKSVNYSMGNWYTEYHLVTDAESEYDVFCIQNYEADTTNYLGYNILNRDEYSVLSDPKLLQAAWIVDQWYTAAGSWGNDDYNKSEVQSAIWEVVFENSETFDVNNDSSQKGEFYINSWNPSNLGTNSDVNAILNAIPDTISLNNNIKIAKHDVSQDYLILWDGPNDPNNPVPEPATMLLFGVGLIGLAGVVRKTV